MFAVTSERTEAAAEDSLAEILARSRFGMAIAAMIKMIATTISNSINEKPFCLRILVLSLSCFSNPRSQRPDCQYYRSCLATVLITKVGNFPGCRSHIMSHLQA